MKKVVLKNRWGDSIEFEWEGNLIATLIVANDWTMENDCPGYFFEVEDADPNYISENKIPVFVNTMGVLVAPDHYEIDDGN